MVERIVGRTRYNQRKTVVETELHSVGSDGPTVSIDNGSDRGTPRENQRRTEAGSEGVRRSDPSKGQEIGQSGP